METTSQTRAINGDTCLGCSNPKCLCNVMPASPVSPAPSTETADSAPGSPLPPEPPKIAEKAPFTPDKLPPGTVLFSQATSPTTTALSAKLEEMWPRLQGPTDKVLDDLLGEWINEAAASYIREKGEEKKRKEEKEKKEEEIHTVIVEYCGKCDKKHRAPACVPAAAATITRKRAPICDWCDGGHPTAKCPLAEESVSTGSNSSSSSSSSSEEEDEETSAQKSPAKKSTRKKYTGQPTFGDKNHRGYKKRKAKQQPPQQQQQQPQPRQRRQPRRRQQQPPSPETQRRQLNGAITDARSKGKDPTDAYREQLPPAPKKKKPTQAKAAPAKPAPEPIDSECESSRSASSVNTKEYSARAKAAARAEAAAKKRLARQKAAKKAAETRAARKVDPLRVQSQQLELDLTVESPSPRPLQLPRLSAEALKAAAEAEAEEAEFMAKQRGERQKEFQATPVPAPAPAPVVSPPPLTREHVSPEKARADIELCKSIASGKQCTPHELPLSAREQLKQRPTTPPSDGVEEAADGPLPRRVQTQLNVEQLKALQREERKKAQQSPAKRQEQEQEQDKEQQRERDFDRRTQMLKEAVQRGEHPGPPSDPNAEILLALIEEQKQKEQPPAAVPTPAPVPTPVVPTPAVPEPAASRAVVSACTRTEQPQAPAPPDPPQQPPPPAPAAATAAPAAREPSVPAVTSAEHQLTFQSQSRNERLTDVEGQPGSDSLQPASQHQLAFHPDGGVGVGVAASITQPAIPAGAEQPPLQQPAVQQPAQPQPPDNFTPEEVAAIYAQRERVLAENPAPLPPGWNQEYRQAPQQQQPATWYQQPAQQPPPMRPTMPTSLPPFEPLWHGTAAQVAAMMRPDEQEQQQLQQQRPNASDMDMQQQTDDGWTYEEPPQQGITQQQLATTEAVLQGQQQLGVSDDLMQSVSNLLDEPINFNPLPMGADTPFIMRTAPSALQWGTHSHCQGCSKNPCFQAHTRNHCKFPAHCRTSVTARQEYLRGQINALMAAGHELFAIAMAGTSGDFHCLARMYSHMRAIEHSLNMAHGFRYNTSDANQTTVRAGGPLPELCEESANRKRLAEQQLQLADDRGAKRRRASRPRKTGGGSSKKRSSSKRNNNRGDSDVDSNTDVSEQGEEWEGNEDE